MSDTVYTTKMINLTDLIPYEKNAKLHPQEQIDKLAKEISEVGWTQPIVVDSNNVIVSDHGRRLAAIQAGIDLVPVHQLSKDIDPERVRAMRLFDNRVSETGYDEALLKSELIELAQLQDFSQDWVGYNLQELCDVLPEEHVFVQAHLRQLGSDENEEPEEKYTQKITAPIYVPTGEKPELSELADFSKTFSLVERINQCKNLPDEIGSFLRSAATRHTVFNYEKIAEFYAHADKETQSLFEDSALVIIDYKKAIEEGYMKLSKANAELAE